MAKPEKKKKVSDKEHDSSKYINTEPTLDEAARGTAVVAWGRMNPMTVGHEKLVAKVASVAKSERGMPHIFLTHSYDKKKNPLSYDDKIKLAQKSFGQVVKKSTAKTIIQLMVQLEKRFNKVVLVAGSDRVKEFNDLLQRYNGKDYKFDEIKVVSAGDRDPDADDVSGMSASKMRAAAADGDFNSFKKGLPRKLQSSAKDVYDSVRKGMNMSESEEIHIDDMEPLEERVLDRQQRRKLGLRMKKNRHKMKIGRDRAKRRMANLETLKKRAKKAARKMLKDKFAKNRRYAELGDGEKMQIDKRIEKVSKNRLASLERKLLPKIKKAERDRKRAVAGKKESFDFNSRFEMFMEDYYKGVPKDKKDDREAHFKRNAEKPGDGPDKDSNYKPAPGDFKDGKRVKTKVSKHTKKYKQMYGESEDWVCGNCHAEPCMCDGNNLNENLWGKYTLKKRPHMLMDQNGKVKFDKRFKMYKPKNEEFDLSDLMESTEDYALDLNEDPTASLKKKADKTGMPMGILRKVYNRGVAAWKSGHRPGTTPEQWGHARVNSFVTKSSGTWGKADSDLAAKVRKEEVELDEDLANDLRREKEKQARNKARTATANTEIDRNKATDKLHKMGLKRSMDRAKHYSDRMKLSGMKKEEVELDEAKRGRSTMDRLRDMQQKSNDMAMSDNKRKPKKKLKDMRKEESGAGEEGTDKLVKKYKKDTPCSD